jgi:hypothetical protein
VRGGNRFSPSVIRKQAESTLKVFGVPGISVRFSPHIDEPGDEMLLSLGLPQRFVRVAVVGALRDAGYDIRQTGSARHATLIFEYIPVEKDCEALDELFGQPERNPWEPPKP